MRRFEAIHRRSSQEQLLAQMAKETPGLGL
jgi:hypothetical protein